MKAKREKVAERSCSSAGRKNLGVLTEMRLVRVSVNKIFWAHNLVPRPPEDHPNIFRVGSKPSGRAGHGETGSALAQADLYRQGHVRQARANQTDSCQTALQVTGVNGKTTTYLLAGNKVAKDFHGKICKTTLTGRVKTEDGKQMITASTIEAE
jgi:hypothetical protein